MQKKIPLLMLMLIIGSLSLILSLTLTMPETLEWIFLIVGVLLNVTSSITLMIIGAKSIKPS